jgi:4-amino-4-deoxy-L-arabinose transferase-like glycosyltransferase/multisubunit Na+/H+ antiporter MnhC subunit
MSHSITTSPWRALVAFLWAILLVIAGQSLVNRQTPFLVIFTFTDYLNSQLRLDMPNLNQVVLGVLVIIYGAVTFARVTRSADLPETPAHNPPTSNLQPPTSNPVVLALALTSLVAGLGLTAFLLLRLRTLSTAWYLPHLWLLSLLLVGVPWVVRDLRAGVDLQVRVHWMEVVLAGLVLAVGLAVLSYRLVDIPNSLIGDDGIFYETARNIADGGYAPSPFDLGPYSFPVASVLYQAAFIRLFGYTLWAWRFSAVFASALALVPTYFLARVLFGWRVGLLTVVMMLVLPYFIAFSRLGYISSQSIFPVTLSVLLVVVGTRRQSWSLLYLAGLAAGLGFYTLPAGRVAPFIAGLYLLYLALGQQISWRFAILGGLLFVLAVGLAFAPHFVFGSTLNPGSLSYKMTESLFFNAFYGRALLGDAEIFRSHPPIKLGDQELFFDLGVYARLLPRGLFRSLLVFNHDMMVSEHYITARLAGPAAVIFYVLGLAYSLARWRKPRYALVLIWFGTCVLLLSVLNTFPPRHTHMVPVIPALALLTALGLAAIGEFLRPVLRRRLTAGLVVVLVGVVGGYGLREYFVVVPTVYVPNMENVMFWSALNLTQPEHFIYVYSESSPGGYKEFVPWGIHNFKTRASFVAVPRAEFLNSPMALPAGQRYRFIFDPKDEPAILARLGQYFHGEGLLTRYTNREGQVIGEALVVSGP